jgi:hypothetical protein
VNSDEILSHLSLKHSGTASNFKKPNNMAMEKILLGAVTIITTTALSTHAFAASQIFLDRATFLSSVGPVTVDADATDFTAFGITNGPSATAITETSATRC